MIDWRESERRILTASRLVTLLAVISSFAGALLMLWLGLAETWLAFLPESDVSDVTLPAGDQTVIHLIGSLDRFLIAIVLIYFSYGVYVLFIRPEATPRQLGMPEWLHVESIGQLKQTLAEVILVALFVLFLRVALETFGGKTRGISIEEAAGFLSLPTAILMLAAALKMAQLHSTGSKRSQQSDKLESGETPHEGKTADHGK